MQSREVNRRPVSEEAILQCLTTEHFTLQTARAATVSETNGRSSMFISALSGAIVALAFIGQSSGLGLPFFVFAATLLLPLLFLGVVTFARTVESAMEYMVYARGMSRLRHYYVEMAPEIRPYFILSVNDDVIGTLSNTRQRPTHRQMFMTTAGAIAVIDSVIAGVFASVAIVMVGGSVAGIIVGAIGFTASLALHHRHQLGAWRAIDRELPVEFPSGQDNESVPI